MAGLLLSEMLETKKRKVDTISSASEKMKAGYCLKSKLTTAEIGYIRENFRESSIIKVESAGLHGGRHYSIYDLLGRSVTGMVYVVSDIVRFNQFMSMTLEHDFRGTNPKANSRIRSSFTSFMHENKLHWSMCCKNRNSKEFYR